MARLRNPKIVDTDSDSEANQLLISTSDHSNGSDNAVVAREEGRRELYSAENCAKYASCVLSMVNCCIVAPAGPIATVYHQYWEDPLYGTPGIAFDISAVFAAYLVVDMMAGIVVHFRYNFKSILWDVILHHLFFIIALLAMEYPDPAYFWIIVCALYSMEISTIFLNGQFMAKWYKLSESVIFRFKMGFLISWFVVRVPVSFVIIPGYLYLHWDRMWEEIPFRNCVVYMVEAASNAIMQSIWTVLIVRKTYRVLFGVKRGADTVKSVDSFDLVSDFENEKKE